MENDENLSEVKIDSDGNTLVDPETGITFKKIKTLTGESDIISYVTDLNLSPNGKYLLFGNVVVPMDGSTPFELIDFSSTGLHVTRGTWSPDGTKAAFYSGDALCVVPVSPETGHATGPYKKIHKAELKYQINPGWSPDAKKLTYRDSKGHMWIIDSEGNDLQQIAKSKIIHGIRPAWSPDGKSIAFVKEEGIGLYNIENDKVSELVETEYIGFPVWSPDGKWIVGDQGEENGSWGIKARSFVVMIWIIKANLNFRSLKKQAAFFRGRKMAVKCSFSVIPILVTVVSKLRLLMEVPPMNRSLF